LRERDGELIPRVVSRDHLRLHVADVPHRDLLAGDDIGEVQGFVDADTADVVDVSRGDDGVVDFRFADGAGS
jgi:hypothetical protein